MPEHLTPEMQAIVDQMHVEMDDFCARLKRVQEVCEDWATVAQAIDAVRRLGQPTTESDAL